MKHPSALVPVIAGFGVMLILMASVTAIGVTYVRILSQQLTAIVAERNEKAELATAMRAVHEARYQSLMLASGMQDAFARDEEIMRFSRMAREFIRIREKFLSLPLDEDELPLWTDIRRRVRGMEAPIGEVIDLLQADRLQEAQAITRHTLLPRQEEAMAQWRKLVQLQRDKNQAALDEARMASDKARNLTLALSAGAFVVGLIIAVYVVRLSRRLEKDLFEEKERAQVTLHAIGDAVLRFDEAGQVCFLNPIAERLLGVNATAVMGQPLQSVMRLFDKDNRNDLVPHLLADSLKGAHATLPGSASLLATSGMEFEVEGSCAPIHAPGGEIMGGVLVLRDVTESRETHRKLIWQADHDGLTHLMNRRAFEEKLSLALGSKRAGEFPLSLLYIDLDHFKPVNDSAGHAAGDELLRQISHLMQSRIRDTDTLARMGGDEFAVILNSCPDDMAERIAESIKDEVGEFRFQWEGRSYRLGASIGIVHVPPHWSTLDECLAAADAACYKAKQSGRARVMVHNP